MTQSENGKHGNQWVTQSENGKYGNQWVTQSENGKHENLHAIHYISQPNIQWLYNVHKLRG